MPQVSLYVDDETMAALRSGAAAEGLSLSKYVMERVADGRGATPSGLPEGLLESLYGCLADDDSFERPAQLDFSFDADRLSFA
ncbi:MAG: antitoxin [Eggerthellaceae bacterium]|nr:antitoxin [Eggerthellaceae bacterium]